MRLLRIVSLCQGPRLIFSNFNLICTNSDNGAIIRFYKRSRQFIKFQVKIRLNGIVNLDATRHSTASRRLPKEDGWEKNSSLKVLINFQDCLSFIHLFRVEENN